MTGKKSIRIIFSVLLPIFLILLSLKLVLFFGDPTIEQKKVFDFLDNHGELEGYTSDEVSHLEDVREVMNYADYIFYFLLLVLTLMLTYYKKDKKFVKELLKYGGISTLVSVFLLLLLVIFSFNYSFSVFHEIFFPQGNWTFPLESKLIQTFPLEFFVNVSRNIFVLSFLFGVFVLVVRKKIKLG